MFVPETESAGQVRMGVRDPSQRRDGRADGGGAVVPPPLVGHHSHRMSSRRREARGGAADSLLRHTSR